MTLHDTPKRDPPPNTAVIETVNKDIGCHHTDLALLNETVDPDALDALFEEQETGQVTFRYAGRIISVDATCDVGVRTIGNENEPT